MMNALVRPQDPPLWIRPAIAMLLCLVAGCGSKTDMNSGDVINCQNDARVRAYAPNLSVTSTSGLKYVLVRSDPAPPAKETNTWTMRVEDSSGHALSNLPLWIDPNLVAFMPDHGQPSSVHSNINANA